MALIGNYSLLNRTVYRQFTGGISSGYIECTNPNGALKNRFLGGFNPKNGMFTGYLPPMSFVMPMKPGAMGSFVQANGNILSTFAQMYAGLNIEGTSLASITVTNAQLDQIVALVASGLISIVSTNGGLSAAVGMDALTSLNLTVSSAQLGGIFDVSASGTVSLTPIATLTALAYMDALAGGATPLSPEGLAASLLDNNDIETGYSMRESLRLILSALSGKVSGAGGSVISIRDVNDTIDRIIATVDSNGNRSSIIIDKD
jgi:hypothetical protein